MTTQKKWMTVTGWVLGGLLGAMLAFSASMKFAQPGDFHDQFVTKFGYPLHTAVPIGVTEVACAILYLIPQTAVLGGVLLTGYLGGAVATHVRAGDPVYIFLAPVIFGAVAWLGLYLRDPRIRELLPLRRP